MQEEFALEVSGLTKHYGSFTLQDVSFCLPQGYIMGFIGQNGAGKTTTIKCILNLVRPDAGSVRVFGLDALTQEAEVKHMVGYVGEEQPFYEELTVSATARFVSYFRPNWDDGLFRDLCRKYGIPASKKVKELSKGTRVKFALALALAHRPKLLILDEPMSGLDPVARSEVLEDLLGVIQDERRSVFFSSHIVEDLERVADYVGLIHRGRLIFAAQKDEVLADWKWVTVPAGLVPRIEPYCFKSGERRVSDGDKARLSPAGRVTLVVNGFQALLRDNPGLEKMSDVEIRNMGLEDIMLTVARAESGTVGAAGN